MRLRRRGFLAGAAAAVLARPAPAAAPAELRAAEGQVQLAPPGYPATRMWAYDGRVPGPALRGVQGGRLARRLVNDLPAPTTVHWHGIRLPNAMDGVPGLTQDPVAPGAAFDYAFDLPDAGTFWYHSHTDAPQQTARGLIGALVVAEAADAPEVDADEVIVLADWRLGADGQVVADFGDRHDRSHAGRIGNYVTVGQGPERRLPARRHDRLRLRLVNAAPARIFELALRGLAGWVMALDGMPLEVPLAAAQIFIAPGQRIDLIVDVTAEAGAEAFLLEIFRGEGYALVSVPVAAGARARRGAPAALPPNPGQTRADTGAARVVPMEMTGGAMRGIDSARHAGRDMGGRALAERGLFWALAGHAGLPEAPFAELALGESLRVPLINRTAFPHAIHLHGHHFREVRADGRLGPSRDTILVDPGRTREIAVLADNPGAWLLHCHMLAHHAAGMGTWIRVRG